MYCSWTGSSSKTLTFLREGQDCRCHLRHPVSLHFYIPFSACDWHWSGKLMSPLQSVPHSQSCQVDFTEAPEAIGRHLETCKELWDLEIFQLLICTVLFLFYLSLPPCDMIMRDEMAMAEKFYNVGSLVFLLHCSLLVGSSRVDWEVKAHPITATLNKDRHWPVGLELIRAETRPWIFNIVKLGIRVTLQWFFSYFYDA